MKTSPNGRKFIEQFEGCILQAYDDFNDQIVPPRGEVHGTLTIGYGHTNAAGSPTVNVGDVITKDQADQILSNDLHQVEDQVSALVKVPLTQDQFDALVSFQFNTGALAKSSALVYLNQGNYIEAADRLTLYIYSKGKFMAGLQKRRAAERTLFLQGVQMPANQTEAPAHPTTSTTPSLPTISFDPATFLADIEQALEAANTLLPALLPVIGAFYPPAAAFAKFLPLLPVVLNAVQQVQTQSGVHPVTAMSAVQDHLTPGAPNAPALNG